MPFIIMPWQSTVRTVNYALSHRSQNPILAGCSHVVYFVLSGPSRCTRFVAVHDSKHGEERLNFTRDMRWLACTAQQVSPVLFVVLPCWHIQNTESMCCAAQHMLQGTGCARHSLCLDPKFLSELTTVFDETHVPHTTVCFLYTCKNHFSFQPLPAKHANVSLRLLIALLEACARHSRIAF